MKKNELALFQSKLTGNAVALQKGRLVHELTNITQDSEKAEKFTKDIMDVVRSEVFLSEFDKKIGDVKKGESEEEFVSRSKGILREVLRKKFK